MSLKFTHKPNYFLYADLLIKYIQGYVRKYPEVNNAIFDFKVILNHRIDVENHKLLVDFNQAALEGLRQGNPLITPDPTIQQ